MERAVPGVSEKWEDRILLLIPLNKFKQEHQQMTKVKVCRDVKQAANTPLQ